MGKLLYDAICNVLPARDGSSFFAVCACQRGAPRRETTDLDAGPQFPDLTQARCHAGRDLDGLTVQPELVRGLRRVRVHNARGRERAQVLLGERHGEGGVRGEDEGSVALAPVLDDRNVHLRELAHQQTAQELAGQRGRAQARARGAAEPGRAEEPSAGMAETRKNVRAQCTWPRRPSRERCSGGKSDPSSLAARLCAWAAISRNSLPRSPRSSCTVDRAAFLYCAPRKSRYTQLSVSSTNG